MIDENLDSGAYRQKVYDMVQSTIKRDLTPNEHAALRTVLKLYASSSKVRPGNHNEPPKEHKFICVKCNEVVMGKGRGFFLKHKKRIVKDNETTNVGNEKAGGEVASDLEPVPKRSKAPRVLRAKTDD